MPRPVKWRRICNMPTIRAFGPWKSNDEIKESIEMNLEEFETIRLIDHQGLSQEECGKIMGIGRSTVQRIYDDARKKVADCMVNGKVLKIQGGNYKLCDEVDEHEICQGCSRKRYRGGRNL